MPWTICDTIPWHNLIDIQRQTHYTTHLAQCFYTRYVDVKCTTWCLKSPETPQSDQYCVQANNKGNIKTRKLAFCEGNPSVTIGFSSQRPVMWKAFPLLRSLSPVAYHPGEWLNLYRCHRLNPQKQCFAVKDDSPLLSSVYLPAHLTLFRYTDATKPAKQ